MEINTTRDIARQILRHRSFSFQEFCVTGDSKITTGWYDRNNKFVPHYVSIETLYKKQKWKNYKDILLRVFDEETNKFVTSKMKEVFKTGIKPVYKLTLEDGKQIECTKEHKFLSSEGWGTLESISGMTFTKSGKIVLENPKKIAVNGDICYQNKEWLFAKKQESIIKNASFVRESKSREAILVPRFVNIKSIEFVGHKETYDLEVEHPSHNYVANKICVHNSQRYADPTEQFQDTFKLREARLQDPKNRQNSIALDLNDEAQRNLAIDWERAQKRVLWTVEREYKWAIANGIAKEQARAILPEGLTTSRLYLNGTIRSWVHYIQLRSENGTQLEHQEIARECACVIASVFPMISTL